MEYFIQRFHKFIPCMLFPILCLWSFPSFASSSSVMMEWSLMFVIGLSIPVLTFSILFKLKLQHVFKWRFLMLLTFSLLVMLASVLYFSQYQSTILPIFSIVFLTLLYFMNVSNEEKQTVNLAMVSNSIVLILSTVFAVVVYMPSDIESSLLWGVISLSIIILTAIRIKFSPNNLGSFIGKMVTQWLVTVVFSMAVFLWLNHSISINSLVLITVFCFIISIISSCWVLIKALSKSLINDEVKEKGIKSSLGIPHDAATNLPSQQQAIRNISQTIKNKPTSKYAVIAFKPINFQQVNKVLGHHNSDILLLQLAFCLQKSVVNNTSLIDFSIDASPIRVARLQGLHFLVVLELTETENQRMLVEKLCQELTLAVPEAMSFKSFSLNFELTFGIALMGDNGDSVSQVISYAEDALLAAENKQIVLSYFDNEEVIYTQQHLLKMEHLKQDITDDELEWLVQPQTRLKDRKLIGFELLVYWYNDNEEALQLHEFIETAEHSGEIYLLTKQMITRAFKLILKLQRASIYETVSIKLLSHYLLEPDLVDFIEKQIVKYNVKAEYLVIELPEKIVLSASEKAKVIIDELKSLKVNIAIADFSGSYESLRYIRKMAVHQVKINCENIVEDDDSESENAIVTALIELTQKMELPLIGTSIDSKEIEQAFRGIGGDLAQGNFVEQGVHPDKIDTWSKTWNALYNPI